MVLISTLHSWDNLDVDPAVNRTIKTFAQMKISTLVLSYHSKSQLQMSATEPQETICIPNIAIYWWI